MATPEQATGILNKLVDELRKRQSDSADTYGVETLNKAYAGDFRLHFASDSFKDYFAKRYQMFADNWCGIVADAPHERLEPIGIRLKGDTEGDATLWDTWRENDADALSDLAMLDAIISKRAFALVWGDRDEQARITWEHPSQAIVSYDPETRQRSAGAKVWGDDEREYATLYLADEVWKYQRNRVQSNLTLPAHLSNGGWEPRQPASDDTWPLPNPLGKVPLVELPNRPRLATEPHSDIEGALAMQHAVNLMWAQLFAVSDQATIGQRAVIGAEHPVTPILNEDGDVVGEKPIDLRKLRHDEILWLEDPNAKLHEWTPAKLDVFTDTIEIMVGHIAAQTRTPAHYLLIGGTIANVSGDAMKALETGLVKRTEEKTQHFGRAIRDVFELVALVENNPEKARAVRGGQVLWKDVENRSDAQRADALAKKREIGYPLRYLLELDGLPPTEITRVMEMHEAEALDPAIERILRPGGNNADLGT